MSKTRRAKTVVVASREPKGRGGAGGLPADDSLAEGHPRAGESSRSPDASWDPTLPGFWEPRVDVLETAESFVVSVELPGVDRGDIELKLDGDRLELVGVRRPPADVASYYRLERRYGRFRRVFELGGDRGGGPGGGVDADGIAARLASGILTVVIPKKGRGAGPRPVAIAVRDGDG